VFDYSFLLSLRVRRSRQLSASNTISAGSPSRGRWSLDAEGSGEDNSRPFMSSIPLEAVCGVRPPQLEYFMTCAKKPT
jgi:hypothetical protein